MSDTTQDNQQTSVNSQLIDAIKEINKLMKDGEENLDAISSQILTHAAGIAMMNVVHQQQQMYVLQNTVTTVAAKAMLESNPEEAVKLMNSVIQNNDILQSLKDLKDLMSEANKAPTSKK